VKRPSKESKSSPSRRMLVAICLAGCGAAATALNAADSAHSIWDGVYTAEQAQHGKTDYTSHCVVCHGEDLEGDGNEVPALGGRAFLYNWDAQPVQALFDRIHTTMPQSNPGSLSEQEAVDLVAYILSANKIPAGTAALSSDAQALQGIRFDAKRP
jgi:S-disulfanyl-L-cysteine oxidoreductase SoxD